MAASLRVGSTDEQVLNVRHRAGLTAPGTSLGAEERLRVDNELARVVAEQAAGVPLKHVGAIKFARVEVRCHGRKKEDDAARLLDEPHWQKSV